MRPGHLSEVNDPHDKMEAEQRLRFESMLADLSARFINLQADRLDDHIEEAQRRVCECLGLDLCTLWQWEADSPDILVLTHFYRSLDGPPIPERMKADEHFPWSLQQVREGRTVVLSSTENVHEADARDREGWSHYGIKTKLTIPLVAGGGPPIGAISFNDLRAERTWSESLVKRLELVAQVFANAIVRKKVEYALRQSEARLGLAADSAGAGLWSLNLSSQCFWFTEKTRELFNFGLDEVVTLERFMDLVHPEDRDSVRRTLRKVVQSKQEGQVEYRVLGPDGTLRWMASRGRLQSRAPGETESAVMGITVDVTVRKQAEEQLRQALDEVESLRDRLQNENIYLRDQVRRETGGSAIIGESEPIERMLAKAQQVAPMDSSVLITGETGTGKELLAQAVHDLSARKGRTMVKVNCAALPAPLIEGELFGREKGAYTGAMTRQIGRFEVANGSTIFLDEIGDLPLELQTKLLRVLQDGRFERLGSHLTITVDVRVITATNHDLPAMVSKGRFREDLFHRINVFPIEVPPLRERVADIPLLVWSFVQEFNSKMGRTIDSIPRQTMERLEQHPWSGNVRELRNLIERAVIVSQGRTLVVELPDTSPGAASLPATLEEVERRHIRDVLERTHWRIRGKGGAAEVLGLVPTTLHSRMKNLGLTRPKP